MKNPNAGKLLLVGGGAAAVGALATYMGRRRQEGAEEATRQQDSNGAESPMQDGAGSGLLGPIKDLPIPNGRSPQEGKEKGRGAGILGQWTSSSTSTDSHEAAHSNDKEEEQKPWKSGSLVKEAKNFVAAVIGSPLQEEEDCPPSHYKRVHKTCSELLNREEEEKTDKEKVSFVKDFLGFQKEDGDEAKKENEEDNEEQVDSKESLADKMATILGVKQGDDDRGRDDGEKDEDQEGNDETLVLNCPCD